MRSIRYQAAAATAVLWAASAGATAPVDHVDNFRLLDQDGKSHELYYSSDMKAVVLMVHGNGARSCQALPALREIREVPGQGVEFLLLNSNLQDNRDAVAAEAKGTTSRSCSTRRSSSASRWG